MLDAVELYDSAGWLKMPYFYPDRMRFDQMARTKYLQRVPTCGQHGNCPAQAAHNSLELGVLMHAGEQPHWDAYLRSVYGPDVDYPVDLGVLRWFYRGCNCAALDAACSRVDLCAALGWPNTTSTRSARCRGQPPPAPFSSAVDMTPTIYVPWPTDRWCDAPVPRTGPLSIQQRWPNPAIRMAPYGMWVLPRNFTVTPLPGHTWVEVIRIREPYEAHSFELRFYYHAPGSGIWLDTGDTYWQGAEKDAALTARGAAVGTTTGMCNSANFSSCTEWDTHQLGLTPDSYAQGNFLPWIEIVDHRPKREAQAPCWRHKNCPAVTCPSAEHHLRSGWRARRLCNCSEESELLNCRPERQN